MVVLPLSANGDNGHVGRICLSTMFLQTCNNRNIELHVIDVRSVRQQDSCLRDPLRGVLLHGSYRRKRK